MTLISIISPTYQLIEAGRQAFFTQAFASLHSQTNCQFEHIIVDGASADGTVQHISGLIEGLPIDAAPVHFLSEPDNGLYDAMNKGAAMAKGQYLVFLNSDDFFNSPDALSILSSKMEHGDPSYIFGRQFSLDETGTKRLWKNMSPKSILNQMPFGYASIAFKRDMFLALNGHDTRYKICADYDLIFRIIGGGYRGKRLKEPIGVFRTGGVSGDTERTSLEHMRFWKVRMNDFVDISHISDDEILLWLHRGQFPIRLLLSIFCQPNTPRDLRNACMHAAIKTVRRIFKSRKNC